ncbi:MAG: zinc ABC transporter substrate-binding protein, partial [Elusimicrobiaceae bacterium]|nr:zinc ABC transporter substrate-binding protein [Elusimicrobiaceae bacterium]
PHVWMDFGAVRTMAHKLVELLIELDPAHQEGYLANWHRLEAEIEALEKSFSKQLADCQSREVVHVGHLAFSLLAKRYQLTLFALAGTSHDGEHSARKLADLVKLIRQRKIRALFTEEAISPRLAEAVAAETEAVILPLYTVEHVTKNDFDHAVTYSQLMQRNLDSLTRGLVCARS